MALNNGEAQALNTLMRFILGLPRTGTGPVTSDDARREAMWLMDKASKQLGAGLGAQDVAEHWPSGDLRERYARLSAQLAAIDQHIEAWQDGADPGDTLREIRDRLAGEDREPAP